MIRRTSCVVLLSWVGLFWARQASAQAAAPILLGPSDIVLPPALDAAGQTAVFGSIVPPASSHRVTMDLYFARIDSTILRRLTQLPPTSGITIGATAVTESADGSKVAYTSTTGSNGKNSEEVHVVNTASGTDTRVAVDTEGCIQPLVSLCIGCFFSCLHTPHFSLDGTKVLYSSSRNQPFFVVNADGTNPARLPVYSGSLAPAAQRVISRDGLVVFTSSATNGPTFAPSATDVFVMNLDGSNVRPVTRFKSATTYASNAVITANGSQVIFLSNLNGDPSTGAMNLFLARADGSSQRQLTSYATGITSFSLSADGTRLVYIQSGQVYLQSTDGRQLPVALTQLQQSSASNVVISDDGSRVLFTVGPPTIGTAAIASIESDGTRTHTIYAPRSINPTGVVGLGNNVAPSPGSFFTIYGTNFALDELQTASELPLPKSLGGVSVLVNGQAVPVQALTPWQINAQLPESTGAALMPIQLQFSDGASADGTALVQSTSPAVFSYLVGGQGISSGYSQADAFHAGTAVWADKDHPAKAGETLEFYGTGLGTTNPMVEAGTASPFDPVATVVTLPQVLIGGAMAQVKFAGLTPGLVGLYQVDAVVPSGLKSGSQPVVWISGDKRGSAAVLWVE